VNQLSDTFVYLERQPLMWLFLTLLAFKLSVKLQECFKSPLLNPVAVASMLIAFILWATQTPYEVYFSGAQFIHFLLGPAVVALAYPLAKQLPKAKNAWVPMLGATVVGLISAPFSVLLLAKLAGLNQELWLSLASKNVTSPVAMGIAESIGGIPSLAAALSIVTGVIGAIIVTPLYNKLGFVDYRARGISTGLNCHGIGTAHAFKVHPTAGTWAVLGMALGAGFGAVLIPLWVRVFM